MDKSKATKKVDNTKLVKPIQLFAVRTPRAMTRNQALDAWEEKQNLRRFEEAMEKD